MSATYTCRIGHIPEAGRTGNGNINACYSDLADDTIIAGVGINIKLGRIVTTITTCAAIYPYTGSIKYGRAEK